MIIIDYILSAIFTLEVIIKIIADGLLQTGNRSYLRSSTNCFDLLIVFITLVSYSAGSNLNAIKVLRIIKVLRPLRAISRNEGLKVSI